jgi:hypothetical protein
MEEIMNNYQVQFRIQMHETQDIVYPIFNFPV